MKITKDDKVFVAQLTQEDIENPDTMDVFQEMMNQHAEALNKHAKLIALTHGISESAALDVIYLRTRSRHTQALEEELIRLHKEGNPPMVQEFGSNEDSRRKLAAIIETRFPVDEKLAASVYNGSITATEDEGEV